MRNVLLGWQKVPGAPLTEAASAVQYLPEHGTRSLLAYTPVARMNPYQALLYSKLPDLGIATTEVIPAGSFSDLSSVMGLADRYIFHIHWPSFVLSGATSSSEAARMASGALKKMERLKEDGFHVVYTLHNKISHDALFLDAELFLQQGIIDLADTIHSMSFSALDSIGEFATVPRDKVIVAPHPTYEGVYPRFLSRGECRRSLGLDPDEVVFSLFGALKAYKGLDRLRSVWPEFVSRSKRRVRLVVAGMPDTSVEVREFVEWALVEPSVIIQPSKIPFEQVQVFVGGSDYGLAPYERTLNSGAAMLFLTFGIPVVVPREPSLTEGLPASSLLQFEGESGLLDTLLSVVSSFGEYVPIELPDRSPESVSLSFGTQLLSRL